MANMNQMMRRAQKMQKQMELAQSRLDKQEFEGHAPEDLVVVKMTGDRRVQDVKINNQAIDQDDPDMLSDLFISATNDVEKKIEKKTKQVMGKKTKGMPNK